MPEDEADLVERHAVAQHLGRCGVPQSVGPFDRRHDASPFHDASYNRRDAVASQKWPARRDRAQEHAITATERPTFEVVGDCSTDVLRQRQAHLDPRLARNLQRTRLPFDVAEAELRHVAGS